MHFIKDAAAISTCIVDDDNKGNSIQFNLSIKKYH